MLTIGILLSSYCFRFEVMEGPKAVVVCILLLVGLFLSHLANNPKDQSREGNRLNNYSYFMFGLNSMIFAGVFGFIIGTRSIRNSYNSYGPDWRYELYKHNSFQSDMALTLQAQASTYFAENAFGGTEGTVVKAMTLGDKSGLDKDVKRHFARAGASHILAVSGFHLTLVYLILILPFMVLVCYNYKKYVKVLSCVVLFAYAMLTGMPPSMTRAVIMFSLAAMLSLDNEQRIGLNNCVAAAAIMLVAEPVQLFHIGFQLSFAAMTGICVMTSCTSMFKLHFKNRFLTVVASLLMSSLLISIVCNIFTLPLVVYHFHQIPLLSLLSSLIVSVLVPPIIFITMLWWVFCWFSPLALIIAKVLFFLTHILLSILFSISSFPYSVLYIG